MAEVAYVSKDQFDEFVKRMEMGFHGQEQRFAALDHRFTATHQRFDALDRRLDDLRQDTVGRTGDLRQDMTGRIEDLRQDTVGRLDSLDRRVGSLEGWIRATFVTVVVLGVGVVAQLVFLVLRLGLPKAPPIP